MAKKPEKSDLIPPPPWTREALGDELYDKLARELCGIRPRANYAPDLNLTALYEAQQSGTPGTSEGEN